MQTSSHEQIGMSGEFLPRAMDDARELAKQDVCSVIPFAIERRIRGSGDILICRWSAL